MDSAARVAVRRARVIRSRAQNGTLQRNGAAPGFGGPGWRRRRWSWRRRRWRPWRRRWFWWRRPRRWPRRPRRPESQFPVRQQNQSRTPQQFQGNAYYTIGNSVLNARPYSFTSPTTLTGAELPKAGYASNRFGFSGGGPLVIPHLFSGDKTFWFVNYTGVTARRTGFDDVTTVPTLAERGGDFSALANTINYPARHSISE